MCLTAAMGCLILKSYKKITEGFWWNRSSGDLQPNLLLRAGLAANPEQVAQCLAELSFAKSWRLEALSGYCAWEQELPLLLPVASCPYKVLVTPTSSIRCDSISFHHLLQGDQSQSRCGTSLGSQFCPCLLYWLAHCPERWREKWNKHIGRMKAVFKMIFFSVDMERNSPAAQTKKENLKPQLWSFYLHKEEWRNAGILTYSKVSLVTLYHYKFVKSRTG